MNTQHNDKKSLDEGTDYLAEALAAAEQLMRYPHGSPTAIRAVAASIVKSLQAELATWSEEEEGPLYCPTCGAEDGGTTCGLPNCGLREGGQEGECWSDVSAEKLAQLGWQAVQCPNCGDMAQAYPKPATLVPQAVHEMDKLHSPVSLDRSAAVNLARNVLDAEGDSLQRVTSKGVQDLCRAVLTMDAYLVGRATDWSSVAAVHDLSVPVAVPDKGLTEFNRVINHAISLGTEAREFLSCWREGDWAGCREFGFEPDLTLQQPA